MITDSITIREEFYEIEFVSNEEQKELEQLYGKKALFEDEFNSKDCVEY
jgi:hypothetical protein